MRWINNDNTPYWVIGLLTLVVLVGGNRFLVDVLNSNHRNEEKLDVYTRLNTLSARLQGTIASNLNLVNGLASAMSVSGELSTTQFNFVAGKLFSYPNQLRNVAVAPDFVISHIYPIEGNRAAIGLNLLAHPTQRFAAQRARDSKQIVLGGPIDLVQGGRALVGRLPYYHPGRTSAGEAPEIAGLVSGVIDIDKVFEAIDFDTYSNDLDIAIKGHDGLGEMGKTFLGEPGLFAHDPVTVKVAFSPASEWILAATPKSGWRDMSPIAPVLNITTILLGILFLSLLLYKQRVTREALKTNQTLEREIAARTETEKLLLLSEERHRDISKSMADWIWEVDANGRYTFASGKVKQVLGYDPEDIIGKSPFDFMPKDEAARVEREFLSLISSHSPINDLENWNISRDGQAVCLLTSGVPIFEAGVFRGYRGIDKDITEKKHAENKLRQQQEEIRRKQYQLEAILGNAPAIIYLKGVDGRYLLINRLYEELLQMSQDYVEGKTDHDLFPTDIAERLIENDRVVIDNSCVRRYEEEVVFAGERRTYETIKFPLVDSDERVYALCGISSDITDRKRNEERLLLFKKIVESANEAVVVTDTSGVITDINPAYEAITGYCRDEIVGNSPAIVRSERHDEAFYKKMWDDIKGRGHWEGEIWDRKKDGELFPKWLSINTVYDGNGNPGHYVGIFTDITEKKKTEERLLNLAYFDPLTQLPNRSLFQERLNHDIASARRHNDMLAVMFIDLDRFKYVNDTFGHIAGDQLLASVAARLNQCVRDSDTVARLGGDEFTVILTGIKSAEAITSVSQQLVDSLYEPITIMGKEVRIGASIGVAVYPQDGEDYDTLSKKADMAMYQAKGKGRNTFQFFSAEMNHEVLYRVAIEGDLHQALQNEEFRVYYQPKYYFTDERLSGMEALVRWQHPTQGMIPPDKFIPVAEDSGLIVPLGEWVMRTACKQLAEWSHEQADHIHIAVNLSAKQFRQDNLITIIREILEETGLRPEQVELEITESTIMDNIDSAIVTMYQLRDLGIGLAIDDFGTGYSSLSYLKRFPVNTLKIDRSFMREVTTNPSDASIVRAIIALATSLEMKVVAEGVETAEQLEYLREHGCHEAQGYYFARPLPAEEMQKLIMEKKS